MNNQIHIPTVHPGLVLQDELEELGITQTFLAEHIGVLPKTINEICRGKRGISAEMAWKLSQALGASPNFWLNLQNNWELTQVRTKNFEKLEKIAA
ncbi:MAG: HigA family addiction module antitoxin [Pyrinomonadaceae bacterium]